MLPLNVPPVRVAAAVLSKTLLVTEVPVTVSVAGITLRETVDEPNAPIVYPSGEVVL